ncbi:MAG: PDZ domain-containing protein [Bacteroidia bacterium]|nr:PDZ domain-containing protein [Bacteroidia bacterium]
MNNKDNIILYEFSAEFPFSHFLDLKAEFPTLKKQELTLAISFWRPGRYEPGNFSKNIRGFRATDENGEPLKFKKTDKQTWKIFCKGAKKVILHYQYYSAELNAGSCYVDENQIYVNPIHCVFYCPDYMDIPYECLVKEKKDYRLACPLKVTDNKFVAENFHLLADSPFIYSNQLISHAFEYNRIPFFIHINGTCEPDFKQLEHDFKLFIQAHFDFWQEVPFSEYHFMFQITPHPFYHGVEHANNTVIAIGPGHEIYNRKLYVDVLGITSHELFHAWNVKAMRPADFLIYDYTKENYSELGFVYEGFTTYLGDKLLLTAGLYSHREFLNELSLRLKRHMHNSGRHNYSVLESSFDTWLDGYVPGIPGRKTSIYDEGCLIAFMLDVIIFKNQQGKKSLRDLCRALWKKFGYLKEGYTYGDIKETAIELGGKEAKYIFDELIEKPSDYIEDVLKCLNYLGVELILNEAEDLWERFIGLKWEKGNVGWRVTSVVQGGPAWKAGIFAGDEIVSFNGHIMAEHPSYWLKHYLYSKEAKINVLKKDVTKELNLKWNLNEQYFQNPVLELTKVESNDRLFLKWMLV